LERPTATDEQGAIMHATRTFESEAVGHDPRFAYATGCEERTLEVVELLRHPRLRPAQVLATDARTCTICSGNGPDLRALILEMWGDPQPEARPR
jgi:hypothetical protein